METCFKIMFYKVLFGISGIRIFWTMKIRYIQYIMFFYVFFFKKRKSKGTNYKFHVWLKQVNPRFYPKPIKTDLKL